MKAIGLAKSRLRRLTPRPQLPHLPVSLPRLTPPRQLTSSRPNRSADEHMTIRLYALSQMANFNRYGFLPQQQSLFTASCWTNRLLLPSADDRNNDLNIGSSTFFQLIIGVSSVLQRVSELASHFDQLFRALQVSEGTDNASAACGGHPSPHGGASTILGCFAELSPGASWVCA